MNDLHNDVYGELPAGTYAKPLSWAVLRDEIADAFVRRLGAVMSTPDEAAALATEVLNEALPVGYQPVMATGASQSNEVRLAMTPVEARNLDALATEGFRAVRDMLPSDDRRFAVRVLDLLTRAIAAHKKPADVAAKTLALTVAGDATAADGGAE